MSVREVWGMACPVCGSDEGLQVSFTGTAKLSSDGTEDCGDHEWDDTSECSCKECDWAGKVLDAEKAGEKDEFS